MENISMNKHDPSQN